jgi:hypothetical protein
LRDVVFDEKVFPFSSLHPNAGALLKQEILHLPTSTPNLHEGAHTTNDYMHPIVPVTDVQQIPEVAAENFNPNGAPSSSEITDGTDTENDSSEHSMSSFDPETGAPEADSPATPGSHVGSLSPPRRCAWPAHASRHWSGSTWRPNRHPALACA